EGYTEGRREAARRSRRRGRRSLSFLFIVLFLWFGAGRGWATRGAEGAKIGVFRVLRLLRFLWPRLVGAGPWETNFNAKARRRREAQGRGGGEAEGRRVGGTEGYAEITEAGAADHSLSSLSFSFSGSGSERGWATRGAEGAKIVVFTVLRLWRFFVTRFLTGALWKSNFNAKARRRREAQGRGGG